MRWLTALACALLLPSLWLGFASDDHFLLGAVEGAIAGVRWLELYDFVPHDRELFSQRLAQGMYPWWSAPDLSLTFLRPLSSLLFELDHALFGRDARGYHLHSLLWLVVLLAACARLYTRLLPPRIALLAYAFLCLDNAHAMPTYWIANRHSLLGCALAYWALEAHLDHVQSGRRRAYWLSLLGFSAALLASEFSLSCMVFALTLDARDTGRALKKRLWQSTSWLLPSVCYAAVYLGLGRGASGSAAYVSPGELGAVAQALVSRLPALVSDLLINLPAIFWMVGTKLRLLQALLAATLLAGLLWLWRRVGAGRELTLTVSLRALGLGALLSLLPAALALPGSRQLLGASFGLAPVLATLILETRDLAREGKASRVARAACWLLLFSHLLVAPTLVLWGQLSFYDVESKLRNIASSLDDVSACASPDQDLLLLNAPDHMVGVYLPIVRRTLGLSLPRSFHVLSMAPSDQFFELDAPDSFRLTTRDASFFSSEIERFWRAAPLAPDTQVRVDGFVVTPRAREKSIHIDTLEVRLDRPLSDPDLCVVRYMQGGFGRVPLTLHTPLQLKKEKGPSGL